MGADYGGGKNDHRQKAAEFLQALRTFRIRRRPNAPRAVTGLLPASPATWATGSEEA
ncbi:hypothetical protein GCM10010260_16800 [Streptomyces filipinensis]|uniref:Uncharacterized protein n=1 Tax=Streptomyces filipinensis TaxID=66887 RepID=A0A918I9G1_9ACTN|nr:hypothetical protein GCM10010260_16800 [Streptomyces filipinensis]